MPFFFVFAKEIMKGAVKSGILYAVLLARYYGECTAMNISNHFSKKFLAVFLVMLTVGLMFSLSQGQSQRATAEPPAQDDDLVARGEYLANVGACIFCHTPFQADYNPEANPEMGEAEIRTLALFEVNALDRDQLFAGGHPFELGPIGFALSRNITSDPDAGIGEWSDEELKLALQTGVRPDGSIIYPLMPRYNQMSDADLDALIAYLRTVAPISNEIPPISETVASPEVLAALQPSPLLENPETSPDNSDPVVLGEYLVNNVVICSHCHTPVDQETGAPIMDQYLGGGQPFEGPFGIIYAANITPHETGIGDWEREDITRVLTQGVRPDGRRLALMPWQLYAQLNPDDLGAIISYLQDGVPGVDNAVPATALAEPYVEYVEGFSPTDDSASADSDSDDDDDSSNLGVALLGGVLVLVLGAGFLVWKRRSAQDAA